MERYSGVKRGRKPLFAEESEMHQLFEEEKYPTRKRMRELAEQFNVPLSSLRNWYNTKRTRDRRKKDVLNAPHQKVIPSSMEEDLIRIYCADRYPGKERVKELSKSLLLEEIQLRRWYCRRRAKEARILGLNSLRRYSSSEISLMLMKQGYDTFLRTVDNGNAPKATWDSVQL